MTGRGRDPCPVVAAAIAAVRSHLSEVGVGLRAWPPSFPHHTNYLIGLAACQQLNQAWAYPWELPRVSSCLLMKEMRAPLRDLVPGLHSYCMYFLDIPECFWAQIFPKKPPRVGIPCMSVLCPRHTPHWSREAPSYPRLSVEQLGCIRALFVWAAGVGSLALLSVWGAGWCRLTVYGVSLAAVREEEIYCQKRKKKKRKKIRSFLST